MKKIDFKKVNFIYSLASLVIMLIVWVIFAVSVKNEYLVPSFTETVKAFFACFSSALFYRSILATLIRVLLAFLVSFLLAFICSALSFIFKPFSSFIKPIISVIRTLPTMAVLLLVLVWFSPKNAPVFLCFLVLFPMIYLQFTAGFNSIDKGLIDASKVFKMTRKEKLTKMYIPLIFPYVFSHIGGNLSFAIKLTVSAEVMAYTQISLGGLINTANVYLQTAEVLALTIFAIILGLIIEGIFSIISNKIFKWRNADD